MCVSNAESMEERCVETKSYGKKVDLVASRQFIRNISRCGGSMVCPRASQTERYGSKAEARMGRKSAAREEAGVKAE